MSEWKFNMGAVVATRDNFKGTVVGLREGTDDGEKGVKFYLIEIIRGVAKNNKWYCEAELIKWKDDPSIKKQIDGTKEEPAPKGAHHRN